MIFLIFKTKMKFFTNLHLFFLQWFVHNIFSRKRLSKFISLKWINNSSILLEINDFTDASFAFSRLNKTYIVTRKFDFIYFLKYLSLSKYSHVVEKKKNGNFLSNDFRLQRKWSKTSLGSNYHHLVEYTVRLQLSLKRATSLEYPLWRGKVL